VRSPLLKANATIRPEVNPQSAPADRGATVVVEVVVSGADSGENAANPATASSAIANQRMNAAKRAKRILVLRLLGLPEQIQRGSDPRLPRTLEPLENLLQTGCSASPTMFG
jgi:hypothetical protein